jgi:hypothetical protein
MVVEEEETSRRIINGVWKIFRVVFLR